MSIIILGLTAVFVFAALISRKVDRLLFLHERTREQLASLSAKIRTLEHFVCESPGLRGELEAFARSTQAASHDPFAAGHDKCHCGKLENRSVPLEAKSKFLYFFAEKSIDSPIGGDYHTDQDIRGARELVKAIIPHLEVLQAVEREENDAREIYNRISTDELSIPAHIQWLKEHTIFFSDVALHVKAMIPMLRPIRKRNPKWDEPLDKIAALVAPVSAK